MKDTFLLCKDDIWFRFFAKKSLLKAGGDTTEGQGGVPAFVGFNAGKMSFFFWFFRVYHKGSYCKDDLHIMWKFQGFIRSSALNIVLYRVI